MEEREEIFASIAANHWSNKFIFTLSMSTAFRSKTALCSRTGAVSKPVDYSAVSDRVFTVAIYDIDIEVLGDYGLTFDTYFPEVEALAEFIKKANAEGLDVICQCEYGQSRSTACATAIREYFYRDGINIFADYRYYPNQLVYHKIADALNKV